MFKNIHSVVSNHLFMMGILWRFSKSRYVFEFVKIIIESIQPFPNIIFPALIINQIVDQESISKIMLKLAFYAVGLLIIGSIFLTLSNKLLRQYENRSGTDLPDPGLFLTCYTFSAALLIFLHCEGKVDKVE